MYSIGDGYMIICLDNDITMDDVTAIAKQKPKCVVFKEFGLADDNVHAQNTLLYTDALVKAGKQFEMQLYVDDNHSIRKPANSEHLHKRIMLFLQNHL